MKTAIPLAEQDPFELDVSQRRKTDSFAVVDPVTDLWNRQAFESRLSEELFRMRRHGDCPLSVVTVLVVELEAVNEVHGRHAGDELLRSVACLLEASVGDADMTARLGGDEFALLLTRTGTQKAIQIARNIHDQAATADARWGFGPIAIKVGTATTVDGNTTSRSLLSCAQVAQQYDNAIDLPAVRPPEP